jgi:hypothetical protein
MSACVCVCVCVCTCVRACVRACVCVLLWQEVQEAVMSDTEQGACGGVYVSVIYVLAYMCCESQLVTGGAQVRGAC